jgi:hypothetical protein
MDRSRLGPAWLAGVGTAVSYLLVLAVVFGRPE